VGEDGHLDQDAEDRRLAAMGFQIRKVPMSN
jgi:hypothetical protein